MRKRRNEWLKKPPNAKEIREAKKLARRVSRMLLDLMEAK